MTEYSGRAFDVISVSESSKAVGSHNYDGKVAEGAGKVLLVKVNFSDRDPDGDATNGTLRVQAQESNDGSTYSNIEGGDTGTLTTVGVRFLTVIKDRAKPYIRLAVTVGTDVINYSLEAVALG